MTITLLVQVHVCQFGWIFFKDKILKFEILNVRKTNNFHLNSWFIVDSPLSTGDINGGGIS